MAYKQAMAREKRMLRTYNKIKNMRRHYSGSGVWYDEDRGFYYKFTASNTPGYAKSLRKISNKKVRKARDIGNHSAYRKEYEYKWTLF
jgi:hypothetical protein